MLSSTVRGLPHRLTRHLKLGPTLLVLVAALVAAPPLAAQPNPDTARGFEAGKVYQFGQIDSVNLFNGNLSLIIPIGGTYPADGDLAYGLTLSYNSNVWRHYGYDWWEPGGAIIGSTYSSLEKTNAGPGWRLGFGELQDSSYPENDGSQWVYISPDGAVHAFYNTLHTGEVNESGIFYSRDGSYLKLVRESTTAYRVEAADGSQRRFVRPTASAASPFRLDWLEDAYGNRLTVSELSASHWLLSDAYRSHHVYWATRFIDGQAWTVVDRLVLTAFGGQTATYTFNYSPATLEESAHDTYPGNDYWRSAQLLTSIDLPDGSSWQMSYYTQRSAGASSAESQPGALKRLTLPTLGAYEWTYQDYAFPTRVNAGQAGAGTLSIAKSAGVKTKRMLGYNGVCESHDGVGCQWTYTWTQQLANQTRWTVVTYPTGDQTAFYFNQKPRPDSSDYTGWEYGLPFAKGTTDGQGRYLSQRIYDGGVGVGTLLREVYVAYERDRAPTGPNQTIAHHWENTNRREKSRKTVYLNDGGRYRLIEHSDFDGLGHYRQTQMSSNFPGGGTRTEMTDFNSGRGSYTIDLATNNVTGGYQPWPSGSPWVLGTFAETRESESGATAIRQYCFDPATGALKRQRVLAGSSLGSSDLITLYTYNAAGNLTAEALRGGDTQAVTTSASWCTAGLPAAKFRRTFGYAYGTRRSSRWDGVTHYDLDLTIDSSTGLPSASRDVAGIETSFNYDTSGRLLSSRAESGQGPWTFYTWVRATSSSAPARVSIDVRNNAGATNLARTQQRWDAFGRPARHLAMGADGVWTSVVTTYNAMGWKHAVSEREQGFPTHFTYFKGYDPFGRPTRIEPPDDPGHRILFWYTGDRIVQRELLICRQTGGCASSAQESKHYINERYDKHGRLYQVVESSGIGDANVTTTYAYDVGNRLRQATISATAKLTSGQLSTVTQLRQLNYDKRGFLLSERHPEKGSFGNGYVTYQSFDAMGNAGRKLDGPFDLRYTYDAAGRLIRLDEWSSGALRPLKVFTFATGNSGTNRRQGKVWLADRYNYVTLNDIPFTVQVRETYEYTGTAGAVSRRDTQFYVNGGGAESFTQGFTWDDLGDVTVIDYPQCTNSGCNNPWPQTVSFNYSLGFLTSVPGYASLTYHPSGTLHQIARTNGVTDTYSPDPAGLPRPAAISTSGASVDWSSGTYRYDGEGNVSQIGSSHFAYDAVSRLTDATIYLGETGGGTSRWRSYEYDAFGNLRAVSGYGGRTIPVDPTTNRLAGGALHDAAGNVTSWNGRSFSYDALGMMWGQSRPTSSPSDPNGEEEWLYFYTADDERVWSYHSSGSDWTIRDLGGRVLRHYRQTAQGWTVERNYVYAASRLLAGTKPGVATYHYHLDHLGSPRLITGPGGVKQAYHVYYPYGDEATSTYQDSERMKFTGHEREFAAAGAADDLDSMHSRFFNPVNGRFLAVDPARANPTEPQSWNRYAYTQGNPLGFVDPDGELRMRAAYTRLDRGLGTGDFRYILEFDTRAIASNRQMGSWIIGRLGPIGKGIKNMLKGKDLLGDLLVGEEVKVETGDIDAVSGLWKQGKFEEAFLDRFEGLLGGSTLTRVSYGRADLELLQDAIDQVIDEWVAEGKITKEDAALIRKAYDVSDLARRAQNRARDPWGDRFERSTDPSDPFAGTGFISADNVVH